MAETDRGLIISDEEILKPGLLEFPNGGLCNVHKVSNGQVYYALRWPTADDWSLFRKDTPLFLAGVRLAEGRRSDAKAPETATGPMA